VLDHVGVAGALDGAGRARSCPRAHRSPREPPPDGAATDLRADLKTPSVSRRSARCDISPGRWRLLQNRLRPTQVGGRRNARRSRLASCPTVRRRRRNLAVTRNGARRFVDSEKTGNSSAPLIWTSSRADVALASGSFLDSKGLRWHLLLRADYLPEARGNPPTGARRPKHSSQIIDVTGTEPRGPCPGREEVGRGVSRMDNSPTPFPGEHLYAPYPDTPFPTSGKYEKYLSS